ncbi:MAG: hypothetical protein F6K48_18515 [Okeania sp. SIO3H1]|uniref:hypothetical protein n=1 Tax=Okeania sp. SIO1I7 TaxID=2607772 RepID=UPI0013C6DC4B|nr:hypothetical protein [Okeania sp. SIO1I7]NEN90796.1 hypothetical protein [Okeania sp. SIO3H1]NET26177.1 hypothetical protein [Okeania sp. SIO1I7]
MVNATQKRPAKYLDPSIALLLPPSLQKLAKLLYRTYLETHPDLLRHPLGVAISPVSYRASLIFSHQPILLPGELFIPVELIESKIY